MRAGLEMGVVLLSMACRFDAATAVEGPVESHELADDVRRWSDQQLGTSGYTDAHPVACRETCEMAGRSCGAREEACALAAEHFGDAHYRGLCDLARQVCEETNAHCHACVEGASTTAAHAG